MIKVYNSVFNVYILKAQHSFFRSILSLPAGVYFESLCQRFVPVTVKGKEFHECCVCVLSMCVCVFAKLSIMPRV